jgi:hypothetical protein
MDKLEVRLSRVARITPDASGNYEFFRVAAAPDARDIMVCTLHRNLSSNEFTAEVFGSADGGETWSLRLVDGSSHEVSEDACAFGESGKAYFVAQPWNVKTPYEAHSKLDQSEMHLYRSSNYGEGWPAFLVSPFVDYARIAVDSQPESPFRGRAYIAGNQTMTEDFPLFAVLDGGKELIGAKQPESFPKAHSAQYPRSLIVLKNGDVLASYLIARRTTAGITFSAVVTTTRDGGKTLGDPVIIDQNICGGPGEPSIAEVPTSGAVIAFYTGKDGFSCLPTLARSGDMGRTWERMPALLQGLVKLPADGIVQPRALTFRADGIALATWTANRTVYGVVLDSAWRPLWFGEIPEKTVGAKINLAPYVRVDHRDIEADMDISLQFGFQRTPHAEADAVLKKDGTFVVVWRGDDGQLYSRSIGLASATAPNTLKAMPSRDVTALVRYEANNITYDWNTNTFEYDLALVNASDAPINGPFVLKIKELATTIGTATRKDARTNQIVFVAERPALLQGEHTSPVHVRIQVSPDVYDNIMSPSNLFPRVGIIGRVYAGPPEAPN